VTRYHAIVADPPWRYPGSLPAHSKGGTRRSEIVYPTLSIDEIAALPVAGLAASNAHLYLWTTNTHIRHAWRVAEAWGFSYSTLLAWCKRPMGFVGFPTFNATAEYVLFCRRGRLSAKRQVDRSWWEWDRTRHSAKPEAFLDLVETVSPGPYLELFARRQRLGWDTWGDEALDHTNGALGHKADAQHAAGVPASPRASAKPTSDTRGAA
jgi:N6-adenosine-specific RNA methylase IME4